MGGPVALLKQGVAAWNAWRDKNPNIFLARRTNQLRVENV
jgi:hypothetical protein